MASQLPVGILFLTKDKIEIYIPNLGNIIPLAFQQTAIKDAEVVNYDALESQITTFISTNKLAPSELAVVLSDDVVYDKNFTQMQEQEEIERFLETIPFENVASREVRIEKGLRVIATNKDLYEGVKSAFEKSGFIISIVAPALLLDVHMQQLDIPRAEVFLKNMTTLKQLSFVQKIENVSKAEKTGQQIKKPNTKNIIAIAVFSILIIALGIVVYIIAF